MAKVIEFPAAPMFCSIPLPLAVYCANCNTISNSERHRCGVCGSEAVLRLESILNRDPDPPGNAALLHRYSRVVAFGA
jgi:hypothetical protein